MYITLVRTDNSPVQLFSRLALGVVMFPHGAQKALGWYGGPGFAETLRQFAAMGFPGWIAVLLMALELIGSLLLIIGLFTRIWALGFTVSLTACMLLNHFQYGFFMNWLGQKQGEGIEFHLLAIGITLGLMIRGGGLLSVDRALTPENEVL
ncbi:MAG: DoxX family protein [Desulfobacteraceae bacterium]|nr:DoxX family protein [Desulfobacteraceae bacterium]